MTHEKHNKDFSSSREEIDSLRMETQPLSPKEYEETKAFIRECDSGFRANLGAYMKPRKDNEEIEVADRFLAMDKKTLETFGHYWYMGSNRKDTSKNYLPEGDSGNMQTYLGKGDFAVGYIPDYWHMAPEDVRKHLINVMGSERNAMRYLQRVTARQIYTHEIAHLYQDSSLSVPFSEAGAYYYARELMKRNKWGPPIGGGDDDAADFYGELVSKYGDDVHKLYFGTLLNKRKRRFILSELTKERVHELFPDYADEKKN